MNLYSKIAICSHRNHKTPIEDVKAVLDYSPSLVFWHSDVYHSMHLLEVAWVICYSKKAIV
jgi:hypothetical protein